MGLLMTKLVKFFSLIILLSKLGSLHAEQIIEVGTNQPVALSMNLPTDDLEVLDFPKLDLQRLQREDLIAATLGKPYRYAMTRSAKNLSEFNSKGKWTVVGDDAVWRLKVTAADAHSLSFGFENIYLPSDAKLFVYDQLGSKLAGPYTNSNNNPNKTLWTSLVESSSVLIELNVSLEQKDLVTFGLKHVNQGYRGIKLSDRRKSGTCNIDVACSEGDDWRDQIRSVALYSYQSNNANFICTGQLVQNTSRNLRPLFLTANHCVNTEEQARSMVFFWNFETSECNGPPDGILNQSQSGASLLAGWGGGETIQFADFTLVELDNAPIESVNAYWSGWDIRDLAPSKSVTIHHPSGDEKRISFDNDPATITNYTEFAFTNNGTHLRIGGWDQGTTELGSSGSGLWNTQKHIVGILSGGTASCNAPADPDWYGRLALAWEGGGTVSTQLRPWLDPQNALVTFLDGGDVVDAPLPPAPGQTPEPPQRSSGGGSINIGLIILFFFMRKIAKFRLNEV